jgi:hypothetical protein
LVGGEDGRLVLLEESKALLLLLLVYEVGDVHVASAVLEAAWEQQERVQEGRCASHAAWRHEQTLRYTSACSPPRRE